jgi:hypothetical protein
MNTATSFLAVSTFVVGAIFAVACAAAEDSDTATPPYAYGGSASGSGGIGEFPSGGATSGGSGGSIAIDAGNDALVDAESCVPPDFLMVVDRTLSMHRKPDGQAAENTPAGKAQSKWYLALGAVQWLADHADDSIRFGLELFPRDPGVGCVTLEQRILGQKATNPLCEAGEVLVPPQLGAAGQIDAAVDPETTKLCYSTPVGAALGTARDTLLAIHEPEREQYALLVTDGQDSCDDELMLQSAHALAATGVRLLVVGFDALAGTGVSKHNLNHLACAGRTAQGFPGTCVDDGAGNFTAQNPDGPVLYYVAQTGALLDQVLSGVAEDVCCNCGEIPVRTPPA